MSQHSRRRGARDSAFRTAPSSVIIALLTIIALVLIGGFGLTTAAGLESSSISFDEPIESIDPEAHSPGATYMSEETDSDDSTLDNLVTSLDDLNSVVDQPDDDFRTPLPEEEDFPEAESPVVEDQSAIETPSTGELGDVLDIHLGLHPDDPAVLEQLQVDGPNPPMEMPEAPGNFLMPMALRDLTPTAPNPPLPQRCGVNVAVVLDLSNSVKDANGVQPTKNATNAIIDAVGGSGGAVGIFTFSTRAPSTGTTNRPWVELTTPEQVQAAKTTSTG